MDFNLLTKDGTGSEILQVSAGAVADATLKGAWTAANDSFNDVLTGGSGNDQVICGAGHATLIGGKGADISMGGTGADTSRLSGSTKTDQITDFLCGTDRIELDNLVFKALLTEGQLAADQFAQGAAATSVIQRVVYDQPTGKLWYVLYGSGKTAAVLIVVWITMFRLRTKIFG